MHAYVPPFDICVAYRQGVDLVRAEYIPDDVDDIRQTVLRLKERVGPDGVIFSSGGIGPTHDDVTYEALASAFGASCQALLLA